jgi:hypothetical protein
MPGALAAQNQALNVPAGTIVHVRMIDSIDSYQNSAGQTFRASLDSPIRAGNRVVIPRGAAARVQLVEAKSAGRISGRSRLNLQLVSIHSGGQTYVVHSDVLGFRGRSETKKTGKNAGVGAVVGGGVGALLGGGKGAAIGAGLGAGTGVAVNAAHKGEQVRIGSESRLQFRLAAPLQVRG